MSILIFDFVDFESNFFLILNIIISENKYR